MYSLSKDFAERTNKYVELVILRDATIVSFNNLISSCKVALDNLDNLKGSTHEDTIPEKRAQLLKDIENYKLAKAEKLQAIEKFELTESDKAFRKTVKSLSVHDKAGLKKALREFFKNYYIGDDKINDTDFERYLLEAMGGRKSVANLVRHGELVTTTNYLDLLYSASFDYCVANGTIKEVNIPDVLKNKYTKKSAKQAIGK